MLHLYPGVELTLRSVTEAQIGSTIFDMHYSTEEITVDAEDGVFCPPLDPNLPLGEAGQRNIGFNGNEETRQIDLYGHPTAPLEQAVQFRHFRSTAFMCVPAFTLDGGNPSLDVNTYVNLPGPGVFAAESRLEFVYEE
jgi:hypothetical protein